MDDPLPTRFILLVPLSYNDGTEVSRDVILDFKEKLYALGGGFTDAGTVQGAYQMADGTKQVDDSLQLWIVLQDEYVPELERLVAELGAKLGQESMYLERTRGEVFFIPPQQPGGR